jgi:AcrR family transcriptional regulator
VGKADDQLSQVVRDFRREQVIAAARHLFGERGTINVSMEEIAQAAGVSRSTVYNHFRTREDVLAGCLATSQREQAAAYAAAMGSANGSAGRLTAFFATTIRLVDEQPAFFRMTMALRTTESTAAEVAQAELGLVSLEMDRILRSILAEGQTDGTFSISDDDVDHAVRFVQTLLAGALFVRQTNTDLDADELARQLVTLAVRGLG